MSTRLSGLGDLVTFDSPANIDFAVVQTQGIAVPKEITLVIEGTADQGVTWFMIPAQAIGKGSEVTYIWTNGRWLVETVAFRAIRVRVSAYIAGFADIDVSPGEMIQSNPLSTGLSDAMSVSIESSTLLDGQTNVIVTDIQKRRIEEILYLEALTKRLRDYELSDYNAGASPYGIELR